MQNICTILPPQAPTLYVGPNQGKDQRSPMSRTSLIRPRRPRAVCRRPANGTRLLPSPPHLNTHYKRCPKALRLRLRSDQSTSLPVYVTGYGRSPDKNWLALSRGHCQVRAPLTRRIPFAASGDAPEHGVMVLPWAIAPFSDSAVAAIAGESEQSDERRLKTNAPFKDSAVAALAGQSEQSEERRLKTNAPSTDSTVVTTGKLPTTNAGHGSPLPSLRVVEHFRWFRLPHTEYPSRLSTSPRKSGVVALASPMCNIRWSGQPTSAQASTPSCATVRDLPSPPPCPHHPPLLHPLTLLKVRLRREQRRRIERIEAPTKTPLTRERDRLLAHASLKSHPLHITCAAIPRIWRKIFPQNNHTGTDSIRNNQSPP